MKKQLTKKVASVALATTIVFSSFSAASAATYTVKSGDTLTSIAKKYNTTYTSIMKKNGLSSTTIKVGQKLSVTGTPSIASSTSVASKSTNIVSNAKKYIGIRYIFGGASTSGFDCSGFVSYVLNSSGYNVGRLTAAGFYNKATKISSPKAGDLVFFSGTYKKGISHIGIYLGSGKMISATTSGVKISYVKSGYWANYFTGYGRI